MIKKKEIESRILQLIYLAECDIECCAVIFKKKLKFSPAVESYLILTGNNHFFEAVNMVKTILHPTKNANEISFQLWENKGGGKASDDIDKIKNDFKSQKFLQIRHTITAHANFEHYGDPELKAIVPVSDNHINGLSQIILRLAKYCREVFQDPIVNNYLLKGSKGGLEDILATMQIATISRG